MKITLIPVLACAPFLLTARAFAQPADMVLVPAGEFGMGTNARDGSDFNQRDNVPLGNNDARPQHTATTGAFYIDKTEVTNAQYKKFCDETHLAPPPQWKNGQFPDGEADFPVLRANWYEASAYAKWIGKRLPTEIEWEKAARGTDLLLYPWGNDWGGNRLAYGSVRKVGSFPEGASPYGALDMAGNAAEWTSDWFDGYPNAPTKQPSFGIKKYKVVRGGQWYGSSELSQTWYREVCRPYERNLWVGFRCAQNAPNAK